MKTAVAADALVEAHIPLAQRIARKLAWRKQISSAHEREEMCGDALLGLAQAARTFRAERGTPFGAYARVRIAYAVRDGLARRQNQVPTDSLEALGVAV